MATKIDQNSIRMAEIYELRLEIKKRDKQNYTKEDILEFFDEVAERIQSEEQ